MTKMYNSCALFKNCINTVANYIFKQNSQSIRLLIAV